MPVFFKISATAYKWSGGAVILWDSPVVVSALALTSRRVLKLGLRSGGPLVRWSVLGGEIGKPEGLALRNLDDFYERWVACRMRSGWWWRFLQSKPLHPGCKPRKRSLRPLPIRVFLCLFYWRVQCSYSGVLCVRAAWRRPVVGIYRGINLRRFCSGGDFFRRSRKELSAVGAKSSFKAF